MRMAAAAALAWGPLPVPAGRPDPRRTGSVWSPYRDGLVEIRRRLHTADPIRVARMESPGEYRITYAITTCDAARATTCQAGLRMRFR